MAKEKVPPTTAATKRTAPNAREAVVKGSKRPRSFISPLYIQLAIGAIIGIVVAIVVAVLSSDYAVFLGAECVLDDTIAFLSRRTVLSTANSRIDVGVLHSARYNKSMLWGTYRPHMYMGFRTREPDGPLIALSWQSDGSVRSATDEHQGILFRWEQHDGVLFGRQVIRDPAGGCELLLTVSKPLRPVNSQSPQLAIFDGDSRFFGPTVEAPVVVVEEGLDVLLEGTCRTAVKILVTVNLQRRGARGFWTPLPKGGGSFLLLNASGLSVPKGASLAEALTHSVHLDSIASGETPWAVLAAAHSIGSVPTLPGLDHTEPVSRRYQQYRPPGDGSSNPPLSTAFDTLGGLTGASAEADSTKRAASGGKAFTAFTAVKTFHGAVRTKLSLRSPRTNTDGTGGYCDYQGDCAGDKSIEGIKRTGTVTDLLTLLHPPKASYCALRRAHVQYTAAFVDSFRSRFRIPQQWDFPMAIAGFSNLIGGIGYWHGGSKRVDRVAKVIQRPTGPATVYDDVVSDVPPAALYSAVPSRSKFPRGFLWDEGFHQTVVAAMDPHIALDVCLHWFALQDSDGWIPREVILGAEARARVPPEFVAQSPTAANPPTLATAVRAIARRVSHVARGGTDPSIADSDVQPLAVALAKIAPRLERWYRWLQKTQAGQNDTFRWRGRSADGRHVLTCGLDDYPRTGCFAGPSGPAADAGLEAHVDLASWIASMAGTLADIADLVPGAGDAAAYRAEQEQLVARLLATHWSSKYQRFADTDACWKKGGIRHLRHRGYVNLFPFLTGLLTPEDENYLDHINGTLQLIRAPRNGTSSGSLWTPFGLTSFAEADRSRYASRSENYWTEPIWININFMVLQAARTLYLPHLQEKAIAEPDNYRLHLIVEDLQFTVTALEEAIVTNVLVNFRRTGTFWENYGSFSGKGKGTAPFTGWSALVAVIMAQLY